MNEKNNSFKDLEIGDIYGSSRVARKKFDRQVGKLHTYIRPLVEAG